MKDPSINTQFSFLLLLKMPEGITLCTWGDWCKEWIKHFRAKFLYEVRLCNLGTLYTNLSEEELNYIIHYALHSICILCMHSSDRGPIALGFSSVTDIHCLWLTCWQAVVHCVLSSMLNTWANKPTLLTLTLFGKILLRWKIWNLSLLSNPPFFNLTVKL